jgi:FAD/FMN-containing dehydrogenase
MMSARADVLMAGEVLTPGQDGYDEAAVTVFAAGTPDLVVRPRDASGVAIALRYAVGAGATWGAVAAVLQRTGLAVTSGDTASVRVGGLTLAGGIGWMVRRYGLAIDAVTGAEMVSADGRLIRANATEHPDLLWAPGAAPGMAGQALAAWPAVAARASGAYTGFLGPTTDADVAAAYPAATYQRLAGVKQRYDPGNVFRRNHNIRPAAAGAGPTGSSAVLSAGG